MPRRRKSLRVCFVTGTRAEFGLMRRTLEAIRTHPDLQLQLIVTGMHLHSAHGQSIDAIKQEDWKIDGVVPWKLTSNPSDLAEQTGKAISRLAREFHRLKSDIILVVGDRVEAFAAAAAGHVSQRYVAHVHGGDRAPGQIDDALRHAISKLSHIHFPATPASANRLLKMGEDKWRIHTVGSPGIDGIVKMAAPLAQINRTFPKLMRKNFALIVLHPITPGRGVEFERAKTLLSAIRRAGIEQTVVVYPNNDPGSAEIIRCWKRHENSITYLLKDVSRPVFLGLMRDAAVLAGNSSSGIIEAASFGTRVVDIGPRQFGRERSQNVTNVPYSEAAIATAVRQALKAGRWRTRNIYGGLRTADKIASILASLEPDSEPMRRKLIAY